MSQTYMTQAFKDIIEALKERASKHGEEVKVNFVKKCLQRVNPKVMTIMNIANDTEWKFLPKPDDAPDKGSDQEAEFIANTKDRYYNQWFERVNKGEFDKKRPDMHIGEDAPEEDASEEVDMAALARAEKAKAEPVTVVNEPEDSRERYEQEDRELVDKEVDQFVKELPDKVELPTLKKLREPPSLEHWDKLGPAANLLHALNEFIASTESPPEDTPLAGITEVMSEVLERLDKLEKKQKSLFNAMRDL